MYLYVFYLAILNKLSKKYFHSPKYLLPPTQLTMRLSQIVATLPSSGADGGDAERPDVDGAHADSEGAEERTTPSWTARGSRRDGR